MEPYHEVREDAELSAAIGDDNIIYLRMQGNLTSDNQDILDRWDEKVREAMRTVAAAQPERVLCLIDTTGGQKADMYSLELLKNLVEHNKAYVTRTAVYGVQHTPRHFLDIALRFAHRTNMMVFDTQEEARNWLKEAGGS